MGGGGGKRGGGKGRGRKGNEKGNGGGGGETNNWRHMPQGEPFWRERRRKRGEVVSCGGFFFSSYFGGWGKARKRHTGWCDISSNGQGLEAAITGCLCAIFINFYYVFQFRALKFSRPVFGEIGWVGFQIYISVVEE